MELLRLGRQRRRHGGEGPRFGRGCRDGPVRRQGRRAHGGPHRSRQSCVLCLASEEQQGRTDRQRTRRSELHGLATRDPESAKAFYGVVFGWETLALPAGLMWTLPGYVDHLEERSPGLREQMAQMGAPEGFIDVVAALNPIADDDSGTPAHWSVTFGVNSADAAAAQAKELGGEVVTAPFDAPWTRIAVIKDPQGAAFIASQFVPENKDLEA